MTESNDIEKHLNLFCSRTIGQKLSVTAIEQEYLLLKFLYCFPQ